MTITQTTNQPTEKKEGKKEDKKRYPRDEEGNCVCEICDYKTKRANTYFYHIKKHQGKFDHTCKKCGDQFLHEIALKNHITSRHPELNESVEKFHCNVQGCDFESITRGNLEIHKARKHCPELVSQYLTIHEKEKTRSHFCNCCQSEYKSGTSFHYHFVKCMETHGVSTPCDTLVLP